MQENKTIDQYSDVELKAIKCDNYERIQACQQSIQAINAELLKRQQDQDKNLELVDDKKKSKTA